MARYGLYPDPSRQPRGAHEKAWLRGQAGAWDPKWAGLSVKARALYLDSIKPPTKPGSASRPWVEASALEPGALGELVDAGFVEVEPAAGKRTAHAVATQQAFDFSSRVRAIRRFSLLDPARLDELLPYLKYAYTDAGRTTIARVLADAEVNENCSIEDAIKYYVATGKWPGLVADTLKLPMARPLVEALAKAPGPVRMAELGRLIKRGDEEAVRAALDALVVKLAVFEGLDPKTHELVVGLLPRVRKEMLEAGKPAADSPLEVCPRPREVASSLAVGDLRVFLLEAEGQGPRLRQDGQIFAKEEARFLAAMPEWPAWLYYLTDSEPADRLHEAHARARRLGFTEFDQDDKVITLRLTKKGRGWLASGLAEQYDDVYKPHRQARKPTHRYLDEDFDYLDYGFGNSQGDSDFFGVGLVVVPTKGRSSNAYYSLRDDKPENRQARREAVYRALESLPVGVFHTWESVVAHLTGERRNPLLGGQDPKNLAIFLDYRPIPSFPDRLRDAAKVFLNAFFRRRLLPLETFEVGVDERGRTVVARLPRLAGYFGKPYDEEADASPEGTKVIVQPDFSVIVIGINPAPAAEIAPFCERAGGHAGHGAMTFKITRTSVVRAASNGLSAEQINARLRKHASIAVPENVLKEVREWAGSIRRVNVRQATVVTCPDPATADRVHALMGRRSERLGRTMVALDVLKLAPADRQKLLDHGIVVTKDAITVAPDAAAPANAGASAGAGAGPAGPTPKKRGRPKKVR